MRFKECENGVTAASTEEKGARKLITENACVQKSKIAQCIKVYSRNINMRDCLEPAAYGRSTNPLHNQQVRH